MDDQSAPQSESGQQATVSQGPASKPPREATATLPVDSQQLLNPPLDQDSEKDFSLPGYVLTAPIGRGAYGQVWHGVRMGAGQEVAIKIFTSPGKLHWRYLQREVDRLLCVAEHPHIVTLLDANLQHQPPFYVMALLRRGSLADLIKDREPFTDVHTAVRWFEQIVDALEFAHGKGLLHCDLKPANVLLDEENNVRLVDFGQSQLRGEAANVLGTLNYMAPEQAVVAAEDDTPPDPSVSWDIYSLGATMYALLTGAAPHALGALQQSLTSIHAVRGRLEQYRNYVLAQRIKPIRELNPEVDRDLADIIHHCLQPRAEDRYGSIGQLAEDFRRRRATLPLQAHAPGAWYRMRRFLRRHLGMVVIAFTGLLALGVMLATLTISHNDERDRLESEIKELEYLLDIAEQDLKRLQEPAP